MFETNTDFEFDDIFGAPLALDDKLQASKRPHENQNSPHEAKKSCVGQIAVPLKSMLFLKQIDEAPRRNETEASPSSLGSPEASPPLLGSLGKKKMLRKFPGPAGILPDRKISNGMEDVSRNQTKQDELVCSQFPVKAFGDGPWGRMQNDFAPNSSEIYLPGKYNIAWIKNKMKNNQLINQKGPFLAAIVQKIECVKYKTPIVTMILKDATGQIYGTIVHDLYEEYINVLKAGSVVILKQFGVLTIDQGSNYYLTITANNLVSIYSAKSDSVVEVTVLQSVCVEDFLKTISEVKSRHRAAILEQKFNSGVNLQLRRVSDGNLNNVRIDLRKNIAPIYKSVKSSTNLNTSISRPKSADYLETFNKSNKEKFNFKTRLNSLNGGGSMNVNRSVVGTNKCENTATEVPSSVIKSSQISISKNNSEHQAILQNLFEGLDASALFEDF